MAAKQRHRADLDTPWKEAVELLLPDLTELVFPGVYTLIDWSKGYESLDKELQQIAPQAKMGRRMADKLFKVRLKDGRPAWLLVHIEVQARQERGFEERIFVYHYRIFDLYRLPVLSLVVLCDSNPHWRPSRFEYNVAGCRMGLEFLVVKLLDYQDQEEMLARSKNPFAVVILAQLKELQTRQAPQSRCEWKVRVVKGLYERGFTSERIRQLFRLIDWMMHLPAPMERSFRDEIMRYEEERKMPYVTSVERLAREEGREEGRQEGRQQGRKEGRQEGRQEGREKGRQEGLVEGLREGIVLALEAKFAQAAAKLVHRVEGIRRADRLRAVARAVKRAKTPEEVAQFLRS